MLNRQVTLSVVNPMDNQPMRVTTQLALIFQLSVTGPEAMAASRSK